MNEEEFEWSNFQNIYRYVKKDKYRRVTGVKKQKKINICM